MAITTMPGFQEDLIPSLRLDISASRDHPSRRIDQHLQDVPINFTGCLIHGIHSTLKQEVFSWTN